MADETAVYRKAALERLSTTDELDELLRYAPAHEWLVLAALGLLLAAALSWGALATVPLRVHAEGYVLPAGPAAAEGGALAVLRLPTTREGTPRPGMAVRVEAVGSGAEPAALEGRVVRVTRAGTGELRVEAVLADGRWLADSVPARGTVTVGRVRPLQLLVPGGGR